MNYLNVIICVSCRDMCWTLDTPLIRGVGSTGYYANDIHLSVVENYSIGF